MGITVDEIYIKLDLVYDRHSARVISFVNLDAVDQQLVALEQQSFHTIATHVLTVMVRGIFLFELSLVQFSNCRCHFRRPL